MAGIAAVGAAALAIGFGISSGAQADQATPTPSPTTQSGSSGSNGDGNGQGWGAGGRHGMGGMGALRGDLSELASKLGVDQAKLRDALTAVRSDLKAEFASRCLNLAHLDRGLRSPDIGHDRQAAETRNNLAQKFKPLCTKITPLV